MRLKGAFREHWKEGSEGAADAKQHPQRNISYLRSHPDQVDSLHDIKPTQKDLCKLNTPVRSYHEIKIFHTLL